MRELILGKIKSLYNETKGFNPSLMKWKNFEFNGVHISKLVFEDLNDSDLLITYERILQKYFKQS